MRAYYIELLNKIIKLPELASVPIIYIIKVISSIQKVEEKDVPNV